jgi:hypothetical protein
MTSREILKKAQIARWEWIRRLGFKRYVLRFGVVGFGVPMFFLMTFFVNHVQDSRSDVPLKILVCAVIWPTCGWLIGWTTWRRSEEKYHEATTNRVAPLERPNQALQPTTGRSDV